MARFWAFRYASPKPHHSRRGLTQVLALMDDIYAAPKAAASLQTSKRSLPVKVLALPCLMIFAIICFNIALYIPYIAPAIHGSKATVLAYLISVEVLAAAVASFPPAWLASRIYESRFLLIGALIGLSVAAWNLLVLPIHPTSPGTLMLVLVRTCGITLFAAMFSEILGRRHKL